jgi:hypothetical protein
MAILGIIFLAVIAFIAYVIITGVRDRKKTVIKTVTYSALRQKGIILLTKEERGYLRLLRGAIRGTATLALLGGIIFLFLGGIALLRALQGVDWNNPAASQNLLQLLESSQFLTLAGALFGYFIVAMLIFLFVAIELHLRTIASNLANERLLREEELAETKVCRRCAELVKQNALVCRFCGYEFQQKKAIPEVEEQPSPEMQEEPALGHSLKQNELPHSGILREEPAIIRGLKFRTFETSDGWYYQSERADLEVCGGPYESKIEAMGAAASRIEKQSTR